MLIAGGATTNVKYSLAETDAPHANDDTTDGWDVGSIWLDVTNDKAYIARDITDTAAVWKEITGAGLNNIVEDTSPQLGGNLDFTGKDASGIGHLGFLATQSASAGANALDDYEEGSWTPVLSFAGNCVGAT